MKAPNSPARPARDGSPKEAARSAHGSAEAVSGGWRDRVLLAGFVALVITSIVTVLVPELRDEPDAAEKDSSSAANKPAPTQPAPAAAAAPVPGS